MEYKNVKYNSNLTKLKCKETGREIHNLVVIVPNDYTESVLQMKKLRRSLMKKEKINKILACPECTIMNNCYLRLGSTFSSLAVKF